MVRHNQRAKRAILRVDPHFTTLKVTLPKYAPIEMAWKVIEQAEEWIGNQIGQAPQLTALTPEAEIPVFGTIHKIKYTQGCAPKLTHLEKQQLIQIEGIDPQVTATIVKDWLWQSLQGYIFQKVPLLSKSINAQVNEIRIKNLSSRWGSCSSRGNLSFSWRLVFAPRDVVYYVCAHEVAHLREMNHSPAFWQIVAQLCPDYKNLRLWLRQNEKKLHSYCVS